MNDKQQLIPWWDYEDQLVWLTPEQYSKLNEIEKHFRKLRFKHFTKDLDQKSVRFMILSTPADGEQGSMNEEARKFWLNSVPKDFKETRVVRYFTPHNPENTDHE